MKRRDVLSVLSGVGTLGLAGCTSERSQADDPPNGSTTPGPVRAETRNGERADGTDPSPTPRTVPSREGSANPTPPEPPFPRRVSVEGVADGQLTDAFGVSATVETLDDRVTAGDTARVRISLRATGDDARELTYTREECDRNELRSSDGEFGLFLFPAGVGYAREDAFSAGEIDCPVVGRPNLHCGIPSVETTVTVPASGAMTWTYDLWIPPSNGDHGGCVAPGTYRFSRPFEADGDTATLAFTLRVTAP